MEQAKFVIENLLWRIYDDFEIIIESVSHLSHRDESAIFVTELLLFSDGHVFRHITARLLWLVNIVTNFVMEVTATWRRACWQLSWLGAMLASDVAWCHAGCWRRSVPRWLLTWLDGTMVAYMDDDVAAYMEWRGCLHGWWCGCLHGQWRGNWCGSDDVITTYTIQRWA
jgi:hypothetical protein